MAYTRPGRLYRKLQPDQPLFRLTVEDGTDLRDSTLTGVTIKRGDGSPDGGVTPSTLEVGLSAYASIRSGLHCSLSLTDYGAQLMNTLVGASASVIQPRFAGRIGRQHVDDRGRRQQTTLMAASWTAQLGRVRKTYTPAVGTNIATVISELMTAPALPRLSGPTRLATLDQYGTVHQAQDPQTYGDIGKWTSDLGIKAIETRAGSQQITTHAARWADALANMDYWLPVIRSQALAPAKWQQDSEGIPRNQRLTWGVGASTNTATWGDVDDPNAVVVDHDLTHARFNNEDQVRAEGFRLRALEWESAYSIPNVEIDLLHLLTSPRKYDRDQAARLLRLEDGDPVYLSGDWHHQLQGIHFVTGITETITGTGWTLALSLAPSQIVIGSVSPTVPARVWDSATYPWSDESRTWNAA
ncbi:hypothetical protein [Brachybacterium massiliense]|uniref:hypothetical protein n=1 Tax=Brachybacterium massiliense TaxID=1755098 RepID=UPI001123E1EE|nr:hypothetical protein [Brachybacterium massiliense]